MNNAFSSSSKRKSVYLRNSMTHTDALMVKSFMKIVVTLQVGLLVSNKARLLKIMEVYCRQMLQRIVPVES